MMTYCLASQEFHLDTVTWLERMYAARVKAITLEPPAGCLSKGVGSNHVNFE